MRSVGPHAQPNALSAPDRRVPRRPSSASPSARSFHRSPLWPFTCFIHRRPPFAAYASRHALRASATSALFLLGRHSPKVIMAAYFESYRSTVERLSRSAHLVSDLVQCRELIPPWLGVNNSSLSCRHAL